MAGYNSKFTGQQVDSLLEKAGSSYQKPETGIPQSDLDESTQQILQNVENKVNKEEGKGLSTNDFTNEYKAKVEDSASQEGYFPKMSVGIAANLAGRGEATEQVFTYRPTDGGTSIESGVAKIRRVKGNSVVWNQQLETLFSPSETADTVTSNGITFTRLSSGGYNISGSNNTSDIAMSNNTVANLELQAGHKYAIIPIGLEKSTISFYGPESGVSGFITADMRIITPTNSARAILRSAVQAGVIDVNETIYCNVHDLTAMFGVGNEPDTVEKFRALYPDSYYPYNAGELRNLVCSGINTVGFNQWDEQWEIGNINGETGVNINDTQNIRSANYIPALPDIEYYFHCGTNCTVTICCYDSTYNYLGYIAWGGPINRKYKTLPNTSYIRFATYKLSGIDYGPTYNNDICLNLHHTGWRDGDYEPYKEVTHTLPLSQITNGEPLRKAGSVYDEINETHYIKRVGVRPYAEGDENDATLLTDGTNTNYPLAEPIVTPIDIPLNLDYQAEDFGTEEALLTDNSAPFSADIVYQFNAVDRIRENSLDIEDLLARVIALENAVATTTSISDIPDITE